MRRGRMDLSFWVLIGFLWLVMLAGTGIIEPCNSKLHQINCIDNKKEE